MITVHQVQWLKVLLILMQKSMLTVSILTLLQISQRSQVALIVLIQAKNRRTHWPSDHDPPTDKCL